MPKPLTRDSIAKAIDVLNELGITPLDLLSWLYLLDLEVRTRTFSGMDLHIHHELRKEVVKALMRKAEMCERNGNTLGKEIIAGLDLTAGR